MLNITTLRVYSYFDTDSFKFIHELKQKLEDEGYKKISLSKIILVAVKVLYENYTFEEIKIKLIEKNMINGKYSTDYIFDEEIIKKGELYDE